MFKVVNENCDTSEMPKNFFFTDNDYRESES